jgi:hypothetical protein
MCVEKAIEFVSEQYVGLAITTCIWCIHGILGREITKYTVIYGAYIRFWPNPNNETIATTKRSKIINI